MDTLDFKQQLWKGGLTLCHAILLSKGKTELLKKIKKFQNSNYLDEIDREELLYIVKTCLQLIEQKET